MPDDAPRRWLSLRALRSVLSVGCLTLCVAFLLLWARSYWWLDTLFEYSPAGEWHLRSWEGGANYSWTPAEFFHPAPSPPHPLALSSRSAIAYRQALARVSWRSPRPSMAPPQFYYSSVQGMTSARAPFWFFASITAFAAIALKPKPRYRFSLFDVLALTTFAAMLAALVAWLVRQRG